jgi:hypothetical protein
MYVFNIANMPQTALAGGIRTTATCIFAKREKRDLLQCGGGRGWGFFPSAIIAALGNNHLGVLLDHIPYFYAFFYSLAQK